jgi:histidine triad (HIT) family protein
MPSLFSRIVAGEIPCHKVAEDNRFLAFLDIMPLTEGHTLVIPKRETDYIFDIEDEEYQALWLFAKKLAGPLKKAVPCLRIGVAVVGLEVPHAHIHLVPVNHVGDINFERPKMKVSQEELAAVAQKIRKEVDAA